jgi:hypothetical protein
MKKLIYLSLFIFSFLLISCENKNESPTGPEIQFSLNPQLNKQYNFQRFLLDSLNNRVSGPFYYYEKVIAKNLSIGGYSDAFISLTYHNQYEMDSTYMRVENGKDVYQYTDTSGFIFDSKAGFKNALQKILQSYYWMPVALLSKGNGAEYTVLPKRFYTVQVDTNFTINVSVEMIVKNEGFEDVTVTAGKYKAYKIKSIVRLVPYFGTQPIETIDVVNYTWISDDLDWWIKQYSPTAVSKRFGLIVSEGQEEELISVQ